MIKKQEKWSDRFDKEVAGKMWHLDSDENVILAYDRIKSFIHGELIDEYKRGYNDCLKDIGVPIDEKNQNLYL